MKITNANTLFTALRCHHQGCIAKKKEAACNFTSNAALTLSDISVDLADRNIKLKFVKIPFLNKYLLRNTYAMLQLRFVG